MNVTSGTSGIAKIIASKKKAVPKKAALKVAAMVYASECCQNQY